MSEGVDVDCVIPSLFSQSSLSRDDASASKKDELISFVDSELNCQRDENVSFPESPILNQRIIESITSPNSPVQTLSTDAIVSVSGSPVQTLQTGTSSNIKFSPNYRRRPGKRYSTVKKKPGRVKEITSTYFLKQVDSPEKADSSLPKESEEKSKWIPPRSPYALIQEDLFDNPWQLLIATIFLTKTRAELAIPQIHKFLTKWPSPQSLLHADFEEILEILKPLGLGNLRSHSIIRFTKEFLEKNWRYPMELHGIGKYGNDSYRMFCVNEWREVTPTDIPLSMYKEWLTINEEKLGLK